MNEELTYRYPTALSIAGSDSGGGAGIQADLKTFAALGVYGTSVITAITAQNTKGVNAIQALPPIIIQTQLEAVLDDITIDAVKTGMLHNREAVLSLVDCIDRFELPNLIVDPVMISTSGCRLMEQETIDVLVHELFPRATLITPNIPEAQQLTGMTIQSADDIEEAAMKLLSMGCRAVLIKGGHLGINSMTDMFFSKEEAPLTLSSPAVQTQNTHGTGCTLSAAIAAYLALGKDLRQALSLSKEYLTKALAQGAGIRTGHGHGPLNHTFAPIPLHKIKR